MVLQFETTPMIKEYFEMCLNMSLKYGEHTIVIMEVGNFYEVYQVDTDNIKIGKAKEIGHILNLQVTRKNKSKEHNGSNPYMVGVPNHAINKYIAKLINHNYTVVKMDQYDDDSCGGKIRKIDKIYSPGTYIEDNIYNTDISNYIITIHIYITKITTAYIAAIDVSTGDCKLYTTYDDIEHINKAENDIYRFIHTFNPKEILFNYCEKEHGDVQKYKEKLVNKYQITNKLIHLRTINSEYETLSYQNQFLQKIFTSKKYEPIEYLELSNYPDLIITFIFMLQFVYEHDHSILTKIKKPEIIFDTNHLILNSDSIYQLNLISNQGNNRKNSSLLNVIDFTVTNMGKRLLKNRLLFPITDISILETRYENIEKMMDKHDQFSTILSNICDLEKKHRKIYMNKLSPAEFYLLTFSYKLILDILELMPLFYTKITKLTLKFQHFYEKFNQLFDLEKMKDIQLQSIKNSFFKEGQYTEIDNTNNEIVMNHQLLKKIADEYSKTVTVKIVKSENEGYCLSCTPTKVNLLKNKYTDITITKLKSHAKITSPKIVEYSTKICELEETISKIVKQKYIEELNQLYTKNKKMLQNVINKIAELDVISSSAKCAIKYVYHKPIIVKSEQSTVNISELRHPIIERIIDKEYEVNDLTLGMDDKYGMLIYGVNSSGKSSLIRALGCNIVLAQAGMFVSAKMFKYTPYTLLLSKISCQDNLFKGHSTFISELLEIRTMIKRSDNNTLVLADELCAGTEGLSATSLVSSTILHLANKKTTFMFSTHLHSLMEIEKIRECKLLFINHFSITIDENQTISYNRKLQEGHGNSLYGLEIANSLQIGTEFMKNAFEIRSILEQKNPFILNTKKSKYNANLYVDECSTCKKQEEQVGPLHTHHIHFQKNANKCGIINDKHFHKNILHNLIILCSKCHQDVHKNHE